MVETIRNIEKSLGSSVKQRTESEGELYRIGRRSIVAANNIPAGTIITNDMLDIKRPGYGIPPKLFDIVVGRKAKQDIGEDDILTWDMV